MRMQNSGQNPRRLKTQAVRPRDDESRKGMLTKRGNAHQEKGAKVFSLR